jgi:hypothetical protein
MDVNGTTLFYGHWLNVRSLLTVVTNGSNYKWHADESCRPNYSRLQDKSFTDDICGDNRPRTLQVSLAALGAFALLIARW